MVSRPRAVGMSSRSSHDGATLVGRGSRMTDGFRRAANLLVPVPVVRTKRAPSRGLALGHGSDFASSC
jgi:hypothetical protein